MNKRILVVGNEEDVAQVKEAMEGLEFEVVKQDPDSTTINGRKAELIVIDECYDPKADFMSLIARTAETYLFSEDKPTIVNAKKGPVIKGKRGKAKRW